MSDRTRKLTISAMIAAIAYVAMLVSRIPISSMDFLKYDAKDIVIAIGGFILGPFSAFLISVVVSLIEMVTVSSTGPWGFLMNVIATCGFACTASWIYRKDHTMRGAIIGLASGTIAMTALMLIWNYFVTPIYMGYPREAVAAMLIPVFLPFNLIKAGLNAAGALLLYKPIVSALRLAHFMPPSQSSAKRKINPGVIIAALIIIATCTLAILFVRDIL